MLKNYNINDDPYFVRYVNEKELSEETEKNYAKNLSKFCQATGKKLEDIITECKDQQSIEIEEIISSKNVDGKQVTQKKVIKFDVEGSDSLIKKYFDQFEEYCISKGNKNTTINTGFDTIKAVLKKFNVNLPKKANLKSDADDWNLLSKDDFKFILADSSLMHKSLILFMLSTGFRVGDALDVTIGEYMEKTSDFHIFVEVDDFIDNAPDDMMGYWDFYPHKTKNNIHPSLCRTFNSPESNKFILQNLRRVKNDYLPNKKKKIHKELKLTKEDSIFGSKRTYYKKSPLSESISTMLGKKDKQLYDWHINKIQQKIKDGVISAEDYDKEVALIPQFHPHACRKYFCTMIERHTTNQRRYLLMEGHAPIYKNDRSYIDISKDEIFEVYDDAVNDLSVYYDGDEDIEKLRDDFNQQFIAQEEKHKKEIDLLNNEHKNEISELRKQLADLDRKIEQSIVSIPFHKVHEVITSYLKDINDMDNTRASLLNLMVMGYAEENPDEFKDSYEYIYGLVKKLDVQIEWSDKTVQQQYLDLSESRTPDIDNEMISVIDELYNIIKSNKGVMDRIGYIDMEKFDYLAIKYIADNNVDISSLSDDDRKRMANDVLMQYIEYKE